MTKTEFQNIKGGEICRLTIERYYDEVARIVEKGDTTLTVTDGESTMVVHWTELELLNFSAIQVGDVVRTKRIMENFVYSTKETVISVDNISFTTEKERYYKENGFNSHADRICMEIVSRKTK